MFHAGRASLLLTCVLGALSYCLNVSDFVPEAQRVDVTINGRAMPIGFAGPNWDSAKLYSHIGAIITREVLGFNSVVGPHGDGSYSSYMLAVDGDEIHFLSEIWSKFSASIIAFEEANPERALPRLKTLDYSGRDGMNIFPHSYMPYYEAYGKSLEYYQYFNASVVSLTTEFSKLADFDLSQLSACDDPTSGAAAEMDYYLATTGDSAAFQVVNGVRSWICHQEKWWLAPSCRADSTSCVPLLTHQFWAWSEMQQKASYFNMPVGMASTPSHDIYVQWPKQNKMLAPWNLGSTTSPSSIWSLSIYL